MNNKRLNFCSVILLNIAVVFNNASLMWGQDPAPVLQIREPLYLSIKEAIELSLYNSYDIQLLKYDIWISRTRAGVAESVYDTFFEMDINYENDQHKKTSTILGTKSIDHHYDIGFSKKLPSGTDISFDLTNHRNWINTPFTTSALTHDSSLKLTIEQALGQNFFGLKDRGGVKVTKLDIENSQFTSLEKIETEIGRVQKAYWDLVLAIQLQAIARDMLSQAEELYRIHEKKIANGLTELPELYAAEANYRARLAELLLDENDVKTKINVLKLLLNLSDDVQDILPVDSLDLPQKNISTHEAIQLAFENRRDYQSQLTQVKQKGIELEMSSSGLWPEINLTASLAQNGLGDHFSRSLRNISQEDNPDLFAGLEISFPLENTKARSEFDKAKLEKAKTLINLKLVEKKIFIGVADRVRDTNVFLEQARSRQNIAYLQQKKLLEEENRFQTGRSNTDTIIRFQEDLLQARWKEAQAVYDYQMKLIDLNKEQGTLLNDYWDGKL
jgi:outer membrane protein TolC